MTTLTPFCYRWDLQKQEAVKLPAEPVAAAYETLPVFDPQAWTAEAAAQDFPDLRKTYQWETCRMIGTRPPTFTQWWEEESNCYLYALNDRSLFLNRVAQHSDIGVIAGDYSNDPILSFAENAIKRALRDGLTYTGNALVWQDKMRPVALMIADDVDFHWLRLDCLAQDEPSDAAFPSVVWTHKGRQSKPEIVTTRLGSPICDPREARISTAEGLPYRFCGFYNVPLDLSIDAAEVQICSKENRQKPILRPCERPVTGPQGTARFLVPVQG